MGLVRQAELAGHEGEGKEHVLIYVVLIWVLIYCVGGVTSVGRAGLYDAGVFGHW